GGTVPNRKATVNLETGTDDVGISLASPVGWMDCLAVPFDFRIVGKPSCVAWFQVCREQFRALHAVGMAVRRPDCRPRTQHYLSFVREPLCFYGSIAIAPGE